MKSCDIAHQVIETISSYLSGTVQIDAVKFSIISVWYGISKSGTTGSPNFCTSTFSVSFLPIGTLGSMILGIVIMILVTFSFNSFLSQQGFQDVLHLLLPASLLLLLLPSYPVPSEHRSAWKVYFSLHEDYLLPAVFFLLLHQFDYFIYQW